MDNIEEELFNKCNQLLGLLLEEPGIIQLRVTGYHVHHLVEILVYKTAAIAMKEKFPNYIVKAEELRDNNFMIRGGPSKKVQNASYVSLSNDSQRHYEVHIGLELIGRSGEAHELDVSILKTTPFNRASFKDRTINLNFNFLYGIEVKSYNQSSLNKNQARAFLGVLKDFGTSTGAFFATSTRRTTHDFFTSYLERYRVAAFMRTDTNYQNVDNDLNDLKEDIQFKFT